MGSGEGVKAVASYESCVFRFSSHPADHTSSL